MVGWIQNRDLSKSLLTEAEWEYAVRGRLAGKRYPWVNDESVAGGDAHFDN